MSDLYSTVPLHGRVETWYDQPLFRSGNASLVDVALGSCFSSQLPQLKRGNASVVEVGRELMLPNQAITSGTYTQQRTSA